MSGRPSTRVEVMSAQYLITVPRRASRRCVPRQYWPSARVSEGMLPRYAVTTNPGDALWVPPWTWHRVDYGSGGLSVAASLFHFRPVDFVQRQPFFAFAIVPNMVKELLGWKTQ